MEVSPTRSDDYFLSNRTAILNEEEEDRMPTKQRTNIFWSLGKSILQGFCKPKRNAFTNDADDGEDEGHDDDQSVFPSITTLVTRQQSPYYYSSTQSILEIWVAACVLLGWTIRVLQYKDTSLALTSAVASKL